MGREMPVAREPEESMEMKRSDYMPIKESRPTRRFWVFVNYCSLFLLLVLWNMLPWFGADDRFRLFSLVLFIPLTVFSFVIVQVRTGLWMLVHRRADDLDERELQDTLVALRYAYTIFAVICLSVLFVQAIVFEKEIIFVDMLLVSSLIYFAHSLPASILAWTKREV